MLYFDTSFLVPLVLPEATSDKIARFIGGLPVEKLTVSHWTRVEFSSLLAREVRMGGLEAKAAMRADDQFEEIIDESFVVLIPI
jgi:predicted nucleic acid-binding protein